MTLYRKYRPQIFADFVNQAPIKATIQNQIAKSFLAHAYLFTGPRGVGKTTMARLIAKALNCERRPKGEWEPCNECTPCQEINKGIFLDLEEKDAASNRGIDDIRNLREKVRFAPSRARYKIFIIDEVHMLTLPAFNALLKTLEEPPAQTIFILATTEPFRLPETIISRCQRFDFKKVSFGEIEKFLEKIVKLENFQVESKILTNIAIRSEGCLRDALSILGQILTLVSEGADKIITWDEARLVIPRSDQGLISELVLKLERCDTAGAVKSINLLISDGVDLDQFTLDLINFLRDKMIVAITAGLNAPARFYSRLLDIFLKRYNDLKQASFLPQLPLELGVLEAGEYTLTDLGGEQQINDILPADNHGEPSPPQKPEVRDEHLAPSKSESEICVEPTASAKIDLAAIQAKWPEILLQVRARNHSLPVALTACRPLRVDGNKLVLGFKYKIHYNAVCSQTNRRSLENLLAEICQDKIIVAGEVVENLDIIKSADVALTIEAAMDDVKEVFGSEMAS